MSEMNIDRAHEPTPWDWNSLDIVQLRHHWQDLAAWVAWLQESYRPFVQLPPCWPRHECLRRELTFFYYWHGELNQGTSAYEGIGWHRDLRAAAEAWKALLDCEHEELALPWNAADPEAGARFAEHLEQAIRLEEGLDA